MFYFFSKLLAFLIQPLIWVLLLLVLGILTKNPVRKRRRFRMAFLLLILFTNPFLLNLAQRLWEIPPVTMDSLPEEVRTVVVLGGYIAHGSQAPDDRLNFNQYPNRLTHAAELYGANKVDCILLSGRMEEEPVPGILPDSPAQRFLERMQIPAGDVLLEYLSRNTYENIRFSIDLLEGQGLEKRVILVTSAFHMRRALAICRSQGLDCIPYATDILQKKPQWNPNTWLIPSGGALEKWDLLIKEWIGMVAYRAAGYI